MSGSSPPAPEEDELVAHIQALVDRRRYARAAQALREGLSRYPDSQALIYLSSYIDWAQGRLDEAEQTLRHLLTLDPEHRGGRIQDARLLVSRGDAEGAERAWIALLGGEPDNADYYGEYAELLLGKSRYLKAIELATEGLRHQPDHEHCLYVVAIAKVRQYGQLDGNPEISVLTALHPESERSAFVRLVVLEKKRKYREAYRVCQQMLQSYPESDVWLENTRNFKVLSHWSMLPLYPFQASGFAASFVGFLLITMLLLLCTIIFPAMPIEVKMMFIWAWVVHSVYCWVWPSVLRNSV